MRAKSLRGIYPVAWQHVNLFGSFEFNQSTSKVNIDVLVARYADSSSWKIALKGEMKGSLG